MKMNSNGSKNLSCGFAGESVSFLYGELIGREQTRFEEHLGECSHCADELAAFSSVSASVSEWKASDFDRLTLPRIEIPFETQTIKNRESETPAGWLDALRSLFAGSPGWASATAAALLLAIGAGFVFFALKAPVGSEPVDLANAAAVGPVALDSPENGDNTPVIGTKSELAAAPDNEVKTEVVPSAPKEAAEINDDRARPARKRSRPALEAVKPKTAALPANDVPKANLPVERPMNLTAVETESQKTPRLNSLPEEYEDNSLRLTDLLADIDSK